MGLGPASEEASLDVPLVELVLDRQQVACTRLAKQMRFVTLSSLGVDIEDAQVKHTGECAGKSSMDGMLNGHLLDGKLHGEMEGSAGLILVLSHKPASCGGAGGDDPASVLNAERKRDLFSVGLGDVKHFIFYDRRCFVVLYPSIE